MEGAIFDCCDLKKANFNGCHLEKATFENRCDLRGTDFYNAFLEGAKFIDTTINDDTDFNYAYFDKSTKLPFPSYVARKKRMFLMKDGSLVAGWVEIPPL